MASLPLIDHSVQREEMLLRGREVVRMECDALSLLEEALDGNFIDACEAILSCKRQLVVVGMGKSGLIGRKVAATFAATGTPAMFVHPAEASHGDMGMLARGDVLLVLSNSGNTAELRPIMRYARKIGVPVIGAASRGNSLVIDHSDIGILLPAVREACIMNVAPTSSTAVQLALGDALAMTVMDLRNLSRQFLRDIHPGGTIGLRLTPVGEIMQGPERLPLVTADAEMDDVISVMTGGHFGVAGVVGQDGRLIGMITDGDVRRHFSELPNALARDVMTRDPKIICPAMIASDALAFLTDAKITAAFILDSESEGRPVGIVSIHELLRYGLN